MTEKTQPLVTVVVCTRNRSGTVARAVSSILLNDYSRFEVIIVDQSDDHVSESALKPFLTDARIRYARTTTRGLATARNLGVGEAKGEIIALTDDDCETPTNWLRDIVGAFAVETRIGIVYGNVLPGSHDQTLGFIPSYVRDKPYLARRLNEKRRADGIGACMAIRRSVWEALSGFDEMLGAGAPFKSAEELDFTIRAMLAGHYIYETPKVAVIHHGIRTWAQARTLLQGYLYGIGGMFAKLLKSGRWSVIQLLLHLGWRWAFGQPAVDFGHRPARLMRLSAFVHGFITGLFTPVEKNRSHYKAGQKASAAEQHEPSAVK